MKNPPTAAQDILRVLATHIERGTVRTDIPATYLGYKDVLDELRLTRERTETWGKALERQGLDELAFWTRDEQHPAVTGLIIDRGTSKPGPGYFRLFDKSTDDLAWWREQIEASLGYRWTRFLSASEPLQPDLTPEAADLAPPERVLTNNYRILRDTELARRVKELHQFKCQLCSERIELSEGFYAEGHHIQPLGQPYNGPDVLANIICVCPTCHVKLDYGVIPLDADRITRSGHHVIEARYIEFHNRVIHGREGSE